MGEGRRPERDEGSATTRRLVWITRAEPGASATAERLAALGFEPLVAPVLRVEPIETAIALGDARALAFTSANAVRAFAGLSPERALPVFAVGGATAQAARAAGFTAVESADGDAQALARLIAARKPGLVLHPAAAEPAQDLKALVGDAAEVRTLPVYAAVDAPPAGALSRLPEIAAVLVHSPKAARRLAALLDRSEDAEFLCISEAAAETLRRKGFSRVRAAAAPDEASLLALLEAPAPPPAPIRLMDARYWTAMAFLVLCLVAAVVVALEGPKIWPKHAQPAAAKAIPSTADPR